MRAATFEGGSRWAGSHCPIAVGDYDRVRPLVDGSVQIDGVDPVFMLLEPEEIFFRAFRHADFDICELSMSSFTVKTANGDCPYVGVPVFPSRAFRHNSIYVRTDRGIARPEDLKGQPHRRAGIPGHRQRVDPCTAGGRVWRETVGRHLGARRLRAGGAHREDRAEPAARRSRSRMRRTAPPSPACWPMARSMRSSARARRHASATATRTSAGCFPIRPPRLPHGSARSRIFPIMHILGIRRTLAEQHPWLPAAAMKAFEQAKARAVGAAGDVAASEGDAAVPRRSTARRPAADGRGLLVLRTCGEPARSGGLPAAASRRRAVARGCSSPEELFHPSTHETHRV